MPTQSCPTLCDLMDCSPPGSSVHGIILARYWSGSPFPAPGDLPDPEIKSVSLGSPALVDGFFTTAPPGKSIGILLFPFNGQGNWWYSKRQQNEERKCLVRWLRELATVVGYVGVSQWLPLSVSTLCSFFPCGPPLTPAIWTGQMVPVPDLRLKQAWQLPAKVGLKVLGHQFKKSSYPVGETLCWDKEKRHVERKRPWDYREKERNRDSGRDWDTASASPRLSPAPASRPAEHIHVNDHQREQQKNGPAEPHQTVELWEYSGSCLQSWKFESLVTWQRQIKAVAG